MNANVSEKWQQLYKRYAKNVQHLIYGDVPQDEQDKRVLKIQKKLAALEMEKCQRKLSHRDLTSIEEKITKQKALYGDCCKHKG